MIEGLKHDNLDISEHLETLKNLASECDSVVEMGTRSVVSTWAFAEGLPKGGRLVAIDINHPKDYGSSLDPIIKYCDENGIDFQFILGDTRQIDLQDRPDLLFIDTNHTYDQLKVELARHASKARKYIVLHDTVSCASELMPAINEFLEKSETLYQKGKGKRWKIKDHYTNNNGLMVLERA